MASPDTNQQPSWATYEPTKDCSQGFCSIYCPQWCYIVFPPPPPFSFDEPDDSSGGPTISPLVIAIIGILASAFLLVGYYTLVSKYCGRRRRQRNRNPVGPDAADNNNDPGNRRHEEWPAPPSVGLDEALISKITVCKYRRGDGLVDCADCSVCLGEFQEDESLRLLPKCSHAFHVRCIDTWLRSHSNCPLCRANIVVVSQLPLQLPALPPPPETDDETVVARGELDEGTSLENDSDASSSKEVLEAAIEIGDQRMRRSFSMGSFHRSRVSVADILELDLEDEDPEINRTLRYVPRLIPMKRSVSSGRFCLTRQGRGKNSVLPI